MPEDMALARFHASVCRMAAGAGILYHIFVRLTEAERLLYNSYNSEVLLC